MNCFCVDWAALWAEHRRKLSEDHRQFGDLFPAELSILPIGKCVRDNSSGWYRCVYDNQEARCNAPK